ncbi:MAG: Uncharacterized protein XD97_0620 [Pelotomaculum thermopropionicum]|uniref:Uncharacterized protein n=1 Tax=Pelotomaculum thermopropionicum TaxID=110500 RepID=A0A124FYL7_9FIRM|nr:MAG: Uncharacterized protein XD97_0620 [Pelotomaculum thermopropionicum]
MAQRSIVLRDIALAFLGEDIPAIGPRFKNRDIAVKTARLYLERINEIVGGAREAQVEIFLKRQPDGRYSLEVESFRQLLGKLNNLDELMLKRFRKGMKKKLFILTFFVEEAGEMECLVLTEGLGAVFYAPEAIKNW